MARFEVPEGWCAAFRSHADPTEDQGPSAGAAFPALRRGSSTGRSLLESRYRGVALLVSGLSPSPRGASW